MAPLGNITTPLGAAMHTANITGAQLAREVGVTVETVSRWRNGHLHPDKRSRKLIALALERTEDEIFARPGRTPSTGQEQEPQHA